MNDDRDQGASADASGFAELEAGLETAARIAERVTEYAPQVQAALEGRETNEVTAAGALGGAASALGGAHEVLDALDADPALQQVVHVGAQAASLASHAYEAGEALVETGEAIIRELSGQADPYRVSYDVLCIAEQDALWRVREVEIEERLGAPYCLRLSLITDNIDALPANLLGQDFTLRISRGQETSRSIHGVVSRVDHGQRSDRHLVTSIEVVPALELLRHVHDSRIFQELTAIEIIDALLGTLLSDYSRELRVETNSTYLQREYCVQYDETVLGFFHRLCEEEGLTYFFDQSGAKEVLVVIDDNASFAPSSLLPTASDVPFVAHRGGDIARAEPAYHFAVSDRLGPTSLTVGDFDWTSRTLPFSDEQRSRDAHDRDREQYEHVRPTTVGEYRGRSYTRRDIAGRVQRGRERQALSTFEYRGAGAVTGFTVGSVFTLSGHPDVALDGEYLLTAVRHRGRDTHAGDAERAREGESTLEYENEFVCIPAAVPYRPAFVTPKPRIHGIQTAVVVGPADEEIWTDEHGRIRVQFHWDREGRRDERSTCWVRVMQSWAGAGFGAMFTPRIGMEVVVSFVDGDPDRPLVTGCVYNAMNTPPTALPENKTQTVLRTQSSPGGVGFNELRFEDRAGEERVYVHAQKNLAEDVRHDHSTHVRRNQSNHVEGDQTERIDGDQSLSVAGSREKTVTGDERNRVDGARSTEVLRTDALVVQESQDVSIVGQYTGSFQGGREVVVECGDIETVSSSNKRTTVEGAYDIEVTDRFRVRRDGTHILVDEAIELSSATRVMLVVAGNHVALESDGTVTVTAASELVLQCGSAKISLKSDGNIEINGSTAVDLVSGSSSVSSTPSGVAVSGTQIDLNGTGPVSIAGSMVKVN